MSASTELLAQLRSTLTGAQESRTPATPELPRDPDQPTTRAGDPTSPTVTQSVNPLTALWPPLVRSAAPGEEDRLEAALQLASTIDLAPCDPPGLPAMERLRLPGLRRAKEGRGGATGVDVTMRLLIRSPFLPVLAALFDDPNNTGGRPGTPVQYWIFFLCLARELGSLEEAEEAIESFYDTVVRPEFAATGVTLHPRAAKCPAPNYSGFKDWRKKHVIKKGRLDAMNRVFTVLSVRQHLAIAGARAATTGGWLDPQCWQALISDSTISQPPSAVHYRCPACGKSTSLSTCPHPWTDWVRVGSRAKHGAPRVHQQGIHYEQKKHGATRGFHHVAVCAQHEGTYGRTVLAVDVAESGSTPEMDLSMPLLAHTLEVTGREWVRYISYDGLLKGTHHLELLSRYGIPVLNANGIPSSDPDVPDTDTRDQAGTRVRSTGKHKGKTIGTYTYHLVTVSHPGADGAPCRHHLISDDGAVYETNRPGKKGSSAAGFTRLRFLPPTRFEPVRLPDQKWRVTLTITVPCPNGDLHPEFVLTDSRRIGRSVPYKERIHLRHIPEAWAAPYQAANGVRNNVEGYFSWWEKRFYHKDRVASWGRDAQLLDDLAAAILNNSETWAHSLPQLRQPTRAPARART